MKRGPDHFEFAASDPGELPLIGIDSNASFSGGDIPKLSQIAGSVTLGGAGGQLSYAGAGSFESFEVALGALGRATTHLVLAMVDDADASGTFRDIELPRDPFSATVISYAPGQDSCVAREFVEGGTLKLTGNAWKAIQTGPLEVDANTVLHFEFRTDVVGELQGIGLASSTALNAGEIYQLAGLQSFTRQSENGAYTPGDGWQSYAIAIGTDIPGPYDRVVLMADDDRPHRPLRHLLPRHHTHWAGRGGRHAGGVVRDWTMLNYGAL